MTVYRHYHCATQAADPKDKDILINGGGASDIDILFGDTSIINGGDASGIGD